MGELLAEKARVAEEEAALLGKKASDAEEEIKRLRLCVSKVHVVQSHLSLVFISNRVTGCDRISQHGEES